MIFKIKLLSWAATYHVQASTSNFCDSMYDHSKNLHISLNLFCGSFENPINESKNVLVIILLGCHVKQYHHWISWIRPKKIQIVSQYLKSLDLPILNQE